MASRKIVYNSISNAVTTAFADTYVTQRYELVPESIPCVMVQQIGRRRTQRYATLCNTDEQSYDTYEAQVFAYGLNNAYAIMEVIEAEFKELGFFEETCTVVNNADKNIDRVVARFGSQQGAS